MKHDENIKIEFMREVTESTEDHLYTDEPVAIIIHEQTSLSIVGLVLALPFPILIIVLWTTINTLKHGDVLGAGTMNAVILYLLQFFVVPLLSIISVIIAFIVTLQSQQTAKKIGYISMGITALGFVLLGLFLNNS